MRGSAANRGTRRAARGLSLVELMIAMTIGLFVIGVATTSFRGYARSAELGEAVVTLQTRARFTLEELARAVRAAGYIGCAGSMDLIPAIPARASEQASPRASWRPLDGFVFSGGAWSPSAPDGYGSGGYTTPASGPATPVPDSDAVLIESGLSAGGALASDVIGGRPIELAEPADGLARGAMGLIGDCDQAETFLVDSIVERSDGTATVEPVMPLAEVHRVDANFPLSTRVIPYRRALYYVGETGRVNERGEPIRALYEHLHPFADTEPTELATGVEAMVVRYRQRDAGDAVRELAADSAGFDPARVIGVRLGILLSHDGYRPPEAERPDLVLAGVVVDAAGSAGPAHPDDTRMRRTFERSLSVRARTERSVAAP